MTERTYAEVDLGIIRKNYRICSAHLYSHQRAIAVIKANAYGHGAVEVARAVLAEGCRDFAVATLEEGIALREAGIGGGILVLGYTPPEMLATAVHYRIMQTVLDEDYAREVLTHAPSLEVHLAIDTGMHRAGFDYMSDGVAEYSRRLRTVGIYTHLAAADDPREREFTERQLSRLAVAREKLSGEVKYVHALNSAGSVLFNTGATSHTRLGIMLYGESPSESVPVFDGVRPALTWRAALSSVRSVGCGESIGYGRSFVTPRRMTVGTVAVGYADGYRRSLSGVGKVIAGGVAVPVIGRVCMDQLTVDLTEVPWLRAGDEVTVIGEGHSAADMARECGTIAYEVLSGISARVVRKYKC